MRVTYSKMAFLIIWWRYGEDISVGKDNEFRIGSTPTEQSVGLGQIWITRNIN